MSKMFRKIIIIALVSVFVLGVGVSASAVNLPIEEDYDNGRYVVYADADIGRRYTYGEITVNDANATDAMVSVAVTYNYLDGGINPQTDSKYQVGNGGAVVSYSGNEAEIFSMIDATYTFWAEIPASYGTQEFTPDSVFLEY